MLVLSAIYLLDQLLHIAVSSVLYVFFLCVCVCHYICWIDGNILFTYLLKSYPPRAGSRRLCFDLFYLNLHRCITVSVTRWILMVLLCASDYTYRMMQGTYRYWNLRLTCDYAHQDGKHKLRGLTIHGLWLGRISGSRVVHLSKYAYGDEWRDDLKTAESVSIQKMHVYTYMICIVFFLFTRFTLCFPSCLTNCTQRWNPKWTCTGIQ